jgi:hypothetical protein
MTFSAGSTVGTFALVAEDGYGNSGTIPTAANRFTVVDPTSIADTDVDGFPDVVEALYGTDPLDPSSFPTGSSVPLSGESDGLFSVLNLAAPGGNSEADGLFSVLNIAGDGGIQTGNNETDAIPFTVLNVDGSGGISTLTNEVDAIMFSVCNYPPCPGYGGMSKSGSDKTVRGSRAMRVPK